jgi:hypothetical protein
MPYPQPWKENATPKDRQFLAFALCEGSRDAPGTVEPVRVVAEWDTVNDIYRPVQVPGEGMSPVALNILCWADIPDTPQIK